MKKWSVLLIFSGRNHYSDLFKGLKGEKVNDTATNESRKNIPWKLKRNSL